MRVLTSSVYLQKGGNAAEECEDAFAISGTACRLAIADGASDSYDSGRWARLLVGAFAAAAPPTHVEGLRTWLVEPARAWLAGLAFDTLPWNQQAKARLGSHCTFLGVELECTPPSCVDHGAPCGAWRALAVGDCCLFQVRGGSLVRAFPLASAAEFGSSPALLTTNPAYRGASVERLALAGGELRLGDTLFLATDALAQWFLQRYEAGEHPWCDLPVDAAFAAVVDEQRARRRLRNDDVTLLVVQIVAGEMLPVQAVGTAIVPKVASDRWLRRRW